MTVTLKHLAAACAMLCGTIGVATAQTPASDRLDSAGQATQSQTDNRPSWVRNSNRKTPEQIEVENGNKAKVTRPRQEMQPDEQIAPADESTQMPPADASPYQPEQPYRR